MTASIPSRLHLGTQGFSFEDWVGPFYPLGTPKQAYLENYAKHFNCVELDSTFYGIPRIATVRGWRQRTPEDFLFSAKFPRLITHHKKLDRALGDGQTFVGAMQALGGKLAVLTLQFAYDFTPEYFDRLDAFLGALPPGVRYGVEIRNRQWLTPNLGEMLSNHNAALVLQDLHYMPRLDWITADFTVIRWPGRRKDIHRFDEIQVDRTENLKVWARRVSQFLEDGIEVYGFFNNHFAGHSPASVRQFADMLGYDLPNPDQDSRRQLHLEIDDGRD